MLEKGLLVVSVFVPVFKGLISFFIHFFCFFVAGSVKLIRLEKTSTSNPTSGFGDVRAA